MNLPACWVMSATASSSAIWPASSFVAVSAPLQIGKLQLTVRPSIGFAVCPTDGGTIDSLLKHADAAMYRANRAPSGCAVFDRQADTSAPTTG